ncbi:type 2 lanthipeptide synthetase LanM family protein [Archangium lipolyticum]|uniref:type 2 lanthipeptide synthetase LanM family protein n=1 Tax=Archangium lipolyticum TaxID=2970465 RepID=UPI002149A9A4|nr:type 2 lanthipeptide synthetase LanM family protein [Archangium lipolyticum]
MAESPESEWLVRPVVALIQPFLGKLTERFGQLKGLGEAEHALLLEAARTHLRNGAQARVSRVLLLELHAASLTGKLDAADETQRWEQFIALACTEPFSEHLRRRYPTLHERLATFCQLQMDAVLTLVERFIADREALGTLPGGPGGELRAISLGAGDSHRGGHTVARLDFERGSVMYKPRDVQVDIALEAFLERVLADRPPQERIRVPKVLAREGYGWAEFVEHRYCEGEAEFICFYRNLGHWLAVMRLVGGTDLHSENLVAQGPVPVVVDVESLFAPDTPASPSGRGQAVDIAAETIRTTVLRTGLLPLRATGLALAGVDISAAGALPGQQPKIPTPTIIGGGTDSARLGMTVMELPPTKNHPSPKPVLFQYWDQIVTGFRDLTARFRELDAARDITGLLRHFSGCEVRRILRPTQAYAEIGRMLWHPASMHDAPKALARARDVLRRNAEASPGAPTDPAVIDREIDDLLVGDVPVFTVRVDDALIEKIVAGWRSADLALEEMTIQGALVSAYLNDRVLPPRMQDPLKQPRGERLDARRRTLAAAMVRQMLDAGIRGSDGTVTWISPVLTEVGWVIRPLTADVYSGQGGVALALAEYLHEMKQGRVEEVEGLAAAVRGTLEVLRATEEKVPTQHIGAFLGVASQVWTWSSLHDLMGEPWMLERARARAEVLEKRMDEEDRLLEVLGGAAGVIVPMLNLSEQTGEARWLELAARAGRKLEDTATRDAMGARWSTSMFPEAIGGFAHGATGIGWALARLGLSAAGTEADRRRWLELADQAFAFEESLYRPEKGVWADVRRGSAVEYVNAWCHGSTGIGLAACDLYVRTGETRHLDVARRARAAGLNEGFGWSHTLCHGDLGLWELLDTERSIDPESTGPDREWMDTQLLSSLEERGPVGGLAREAFSPGLMPGLGGVIHLLLRMHPEQSLATPLLLGRYGQSLRQVRAARER